MILLSSQLTKDADALICILYKSYLEKRKTGISKSDAKKFGNSSDIQKDLLPKSSEDDVAETCRELSRANMIKCSYADDIPCNVELTDNAIIYMENRFTDGVSGVLEYLAKIKNAVPFL